MAVEGVYGNLTQKLYQSFGGPKTKREKLAQIPSQRLFDIVFKRKANGDLARNPVLFKTLTALYQAGLEDPFEERVEIKALVGRLFEKYKPGNELEKAILLFRSIITPATRFQIGETTYSGMAIEEGGLAIPFNAFFANDFDFLQANYAVQLPKELIAARGIKRMAHCVEFSYLLVSLLRAASISATVQEEPDHLYVIAILDSQKYRLDPAMCRFCPIEARMYSERESLAYHYSNQANAMRNKGLNIAAMNAYEVALEINSDCDPAWSGRAIILATQGKLAEALINCEMALEINPQNAEALQNKGTFLAALGQLDLALKAYEIAISKDCFNWLAWQNKINLLLMMEKIDDAIETLKMALKNGDKRDLFLEQMLRIGETLYKQDRIAESLMVFDEALKTDPFNPEAWSNKGAILGQQGKIDEAIKAFQQALENDPTYAPAWYNLGLAFLEQGNMSEAIKAFGEAMKIDPNFVQIS